MKDEFLQGTIARDFDFYRIRETIASLAMSEEGRDLLLKRESSSNLEEINRLKKLSIQWLTYLNSTRPQAIGNFPPVKDIFPIFAVEGAALNHEQIFAIGLFCCHTEKARDSLVSAGMELPIETLAQKAQQMPSLTGAKNEIESVLDLSTGEIKDLPSLRAIRNRIQSLKKQIENAIRKYTSNSEFASALQSNVPAYRADRELLAVKADHRAQIEGIVHEVSASGSTLYIEPEEIVKANNELIQEESAFQQELNKIFRELTSSLAKYKEDFETCHTQMLEFDVTLSSARYAKQVNGIFAEDCDKTKEAPAIFAARHPLLKDKAVPVNMNFMTGKNITIITGPNTGGKTVTLKTVALFSLLNQAGFPVLAAEGTRLPVFSSIFADIGDEQSIDNNLSTFSSRMKKIALALQNADENSLVLLDELGSGTDPLEGSALAMAALDLLIEKKSFVLVTTHHGVLKNYGYTNPNCVNASVEFNADTMKPTYKLLMGVPGESHAIEIAESSGLSPRAIEIAKGYISNQQADVSALIKGLTAKHEEIENLIKAQKEKLEELELKEYKLSEKELRNKEREVELKELEHSQSSEFLVETRSKLENLVRYLREGEINREKTLAVKNFISEFTQQVENQTDKIEEVKKELEKQEEIVAENGMRISKSGAAKTSSKKNKKQRMSNKDAFKNATVNEYAHAEEKLKPRLVKTEELFFEGAEVLAGAERRKGTLIRKVKDGVWQVQFGMLKMNVPQRQLVPCENTVSLVKQKVSVEFVRDNAEERNEAPKFELRLLGMRYEEAMKELEHQLDLCAINNFKNFSIVHGKGNGVLQQAVHDYLSHYPGVKDYHFARPEEGGSGKTYVELL